jgi:hypothetical protein
LIGNIYFGNAQANGSSPRLVERLGGDLRVIYDKVKVVSSVKVNDWDLLIITAILTYPLQLMLDISTSVGKPNWLFYLTLK